MMNDQSPPPNLQRKVLQGVSVATGGVLLKQALTLAAYVVLARLAAPQVFGTFAEASVLVWIGSLFVESGMTAALIHRADRLEEAAATALLSTLSGGIAMTALCAGLAPVVGLFFGSHEVTVIALAVSAVHLMNSAAIVPEAMLQRRFSFVRRTVVDPLSVVAYGATAAIGLASGLGVWALVAAVYAAEVARVSLVWTLGGWRPHLRRASWTMWRELASYARHMLASEFLRQAGTTFNTAAVGRVLGRVDLAQYNFGSRLATQASTPMITGVSFVLFPALARISSDAPRFRGAVLRSLRAACFVAFPTSLILIPLGEPLAVLLLGDRWRTAGGVVTALAAVGVGLTLRSISGEVFKAAGRPDRLPRIYALSAVLPALAVVAGIPFGVVEIAAFVAAGTVLVGLYATFSAVRIAGLQIESAVRAQAPPAFASAVMVAALLPLEHLAVHSDQRGVLVGLSLLVAEAVLGGAIYLLVVYLLDRAMVLEFVFGMRGALARVPRTSTPLPNAPGAPASLTRTSGRARGPA
jgi:O-antigen/teichoic acid export membrane protein